jgi:hypothetical protein
MIAILWRYRVKPEHRGDFERAYGPDGDWANLFRRHPGYLGTELLPKSASSAHPEEPQSGVSKGRPERSDSEVERRSFAPTPVHPEEPPSGGVSERSHRQ